MKFRSLLLIFLVLVVLSAGTASASVYISADQIRVYNEGDINLSQIRDELGDASIFSNDGTIWYANKTLNADGSIIHIEYPECTELRITHSDGKIYAAQGGSGGYLCNNVTISGWDNSTGTYQSTPKQFLAYSGSITNTTFQYFSRLEIRNFNNGIIDGLTVRNNTEYVKIYDADNLTVFDSEFYDMEETGLYFYNVSNSEIYDINVHDVGLIGIDSENCNNNYYHDITITDAGDYTTPNTGSGGFYLENHNDCYGENFTITRTGWSGFAPGGSHGNWSNISVVNSGHNSFDFHNVKHTTVDDIYGESPEEHNFLFTAGLASSPSTENVTVYNFDFVNGGIAQQTNITDLTMINGTISGTGGGIITSCINSTFINVSHSSGDSYYTIYQDSQGQTAKNVSIINCDTETINVVNGTENKIVNTNHTIGTFASGNYSLFYPLNVQVINTTGNPVSDATVTLNLTTFGLNGLGEITSTGTTDSTGKLNTSQMLYVPDFNRDSSAGYTYYTVDVQASKDGQTDSELAINPDSSWYSPDLDNLNGTLITLTLDVEGTDALVISDYSPTDTTPTLTLGNSLNFTVTTSKTADIQWFSNGDLKVTTTDKTSSYYDKTPSSTGEYNVTVIADDGVDTVSQTWTLNVTEGYFTGDTEKSYLNYKERFTWSSGAFVKSFPNDGTILLENAPAVIEGVEVYP